MNEKFWEMLASVLQGWTVVRVEAGTGDMGDPARVVCRCANATRSFEIQGGISGPLVVNTRTQYDADRSEVWASPQEMIRTILEHVRELTTYNPPVDYELITPQDDAPTRRVGFRCARTGREWWTGMGELKTSSLGRALCSPEGRENVAVLLSQGSDTALFPTP